MSTSIAEPPPAEVKTPVETKSAPDQDAIVQSLLKPVVTGQPNVKKQPTPEPSKEEAKVPEVKTAEVKKPEEAKPQTDIDRNIVALREKAERLEKEHRDATERLKAISDEYETFKKNPVPKEFEERLNATAKERDEYRQQLRAADLARDPDFQRKYTDGIKTSLERMISTAVSGGAEQAEIQRAVSEWNVDKLGEIAESLPIGRKMEFQAAFTRAVELDGERSRELANAEQGWQEIQKTRQADQERAQKQYLESLRGDKKAVLSELLEKQDIFKSDAELQKETESLLDRAAGLNGEKLNARAVLSMVANSHVLARHFQRVDKERTELATKVEEQTKKIAELEEFIKGVNGSIPAPGPTKGQQTGQPDEAFLNSLLHPSIRK